MLNICTVLDVNERCVISCGSRSYSRWLIAVSCIRLEWVGRGQSTKAHLALYKHSETAHHQWLMYPERHRRHLGRCHWLRTKRSGTNNRCFSCFLACFRNDKEKRLIKFIKSSLCFVHSSEMSADIVMFYIYILWQKNSKREYSDIIQWF